MKKIGIIGSGQVAQVLGSGFLKHGYQVKLGTSSPEKLTDWINNAGNNASIGSFDEVASFANTLVLAVKGTAALKVVRNLGADTLAGKIIIDATNPIDTKPPENGVLKFFTNLESSLMEELQDAAPEAYFVKAFNSVGGAHMVNPDFGGIKPTMFICGNNPDAKQTVSEILEQFGFEAEDMGRVESARAIEPLCMLWCIPGFINNNWNHAFKLLKK